MGKNGVPIKRILIVEDEPSIGNICRRVLTSEASTVDIAINGKVAQGMIEDNHYDLCLIDIRTPEMDGKELYQWLKERHPQLSSSVIFTSGDVIGGDTQRFLEQAARPFLPKPFTPDELKSIINEGFNGVDGPIKANLWSRQNLNSR